MKAEALYESKWATPRTGPAVGPAGDTSDWGGTIGDLIDWFVLQDTKIPRATYIHVARLGCTSELVHPSVHQL